MCVQVYIYTCTCVNVHVYYIYDFCTVTFFWLSCLTPLFFLPFYSLPCNANFVNSTLDQEKLTCFNLCELQNMTKCFCEPLSNDECKLCCQAKVENSTCAPIGGGVLLVDGSTCLGGVCRVGNCEITTQDLASRLFNLFNTIDINSFSKYECLLCVPFCKYRYILLCVAFTKYVFVLCALFSKACVCAVCTV